MTLTTPTRRCRARLRVSVPLAAALASVGLAAAPAHAAPTVPVTATVSEGVGAAGVRLGMTKAQVTGQWGAAARCWTSSGEWCSYASADGVERARVRWTGGALSLITIPLTNSTWTTSRGVHVGTPASPSLSGGTEAFDLAYGASVDPARSTYWSRYVPGTPVAGQARGTRFTLDWFAPYTDAQYFGVVSITISVG
ncbi:MAG: hypothetical protein U0Q15_19995 [Kineosporiaceae bacterium]